MPDILDLNEYRGKGLQPGETTLPDLDPPSQQTNPTQHLEVDEEAALAISQMGFPLSRCRDAVVATGNTGVEPAVMWLMENNATGASVLLDTCCKRNWLKLLRIDFIFIPTLSKLWPAEMIFWLFKINNTIIYI